MAFFELWITDDEGNRIDTLDLTHGFEFVKTVNGVGSFWVRLPFDVDPTYLSPDNRIEFWRGATGARTTLEMIGLVRAWRFETDRNGELTVVLSGPDQNDLVDRRIVAYFSGTDEASKTDEADDMIKEIATENLGGSATGTGRDITGFNFSVQADLADGPSIDKALAWRNVQKVFNELAKDAQAQGTRVYWYVKAVSPTSFELRTAINQPGKDLTDNVVFSDTRGNLQNAKLTYDYSKEITVVYAGGQGRGTGRTLATITDNTRINTSVFGRREVFVDARQSDTPDEVIAEGKARMAIGTPQLRFTGAINDTDRTRYGIEWNLGDKVTVDYVGQQLDAIVNAVRVRLDESGKETVSAKLENVSFGQVGTLLTDVVLVPESASMRLKTTAPTVTVA